ncbi:hypothetical protein B0A48_08802 [Cryoendolithus antarcticus]|uniref:Protein phosphatase n=1 Tax=Cryoendolithus antarcticus TaxID=1507870 RepID=A0A1V8T4J4_9PEZI|nr:hypothetical protein B0A48_08802 [Cryoendolithus antarcticus]
MPAPPMRPPSRGLISTTAILAAGLSGVYLKTGTLRPSYLMPLIRAYSTQPTLPFTYRLAAAASSKRTPPRTPKAGIDYWTYTSTHVGSTPPYVRSTKPNSGEDAFFMATVGGSQHHVAFGLADGVGGWQDQGVDPSDFSHGLCGIMAGSAYLHEGVQEGKIPRPQDLLQTAYDAVIANPRIQAGGSTASLGVVDGNGELEVANLGDSGYLILSPGKVAACSEPQTHAFNTPYQLSKIPARMRVQQSIFGSSATFSESPAQADVTHHKIAHGDIVIFATDGVLDNLSASDILATVTKVMEDAGYWSKATDGKSGTETKLNATLVQEIPVVVTKESRDSYLPGRVARAIMTEAKSAGLDSKRNGPFAKEVKKAYPHENWQGGKEDDIAVVVAIAVRNGPLGEERPIKAKL